MVPDVSRARRLLEAYRAYESARECETQKLVDINLARERVAKADAARKATAEAVYRLADLALCPIGLDAAGAGNSQPNR